MSSSKSSCTGAVLPQLVQDLVHLEGCRQRLNKHRRLDAALWHGQRVLHLHQEDRASRNILQQVTGAAESTLSQRHGPNRARHIMVRLPFRGCMRCETAAGLNDFSRS